MGSPQYSSKDSVTLERETSPWSLRNSSKANKWLTSTVGVFDQDLSNIIEELLKCGGRAPRLQQRVSQLQWRGFSDLTRSSSPLVEELLNCQLGAPYTHRSNSLRPWGVTQLWWRCYSLYGISSIMAAQFHKSYWIAHLDQLRGREGWRSDCGAPSIEWPNRSFFSLICMYLLGIL